MTMIKAAVIALLLAAATPGWELVAHIGPINAVYVDPAGIKDPKLLAGIVTDLLERFGRERPLQIDFFDNREGTPTTRPYPASAKPFHRAKFNFNPANGMRRFVRMVPEDPNNPAGRRREVEEKLPLPD